MAIPGTAAGERGSSTKVAEPGAEYKILSPKEQSKKLKQLEDRMYLHAKNLEFEEAAMTRDEIKLLQEEILGA